MTRIRRRVPVQERQQEPSDERKAQMRLDHEVFRARMYDVGLESDPSWYRDERWWATIGKPAQKRRSEERWVRGVGWVHFPGINDDVAPR